MTLILHGLRASTRPGAIQTVKGQLASVKVWSTPPGGTATTAVVASTYLYDDLGRLREVWDPRIEQAGQALKSRYDYDSAGRVVTLTPAGELPWRLTYGPAGASTTGAGDFIDPNPGRLLNVTRASLAEGSLSTPGPDTITSIVYAVPTTRAAGGPYDLNAEAITTWAQTSAPTDATAVFGPETPAAVNTATPAAPGRDGYKSATVHYLDTTGRAVNTASPSGPGAGVEGFIDTAQYDEYGNTIWSLDATNRLLALGKLPSAAADLAALNLTQADSPSRAVALATTSTYSLDGLDLLRQRGPRVRLAIGNDPANVQLVHDLTTYVYDQGKPDGAAYHLATTQTDAVLLAGSVTEQLLDTTVTTMRYAPIDGQPAVGNTSGWKHGQPTEVTVDAAGAAVTSKVRYDTAGRAVESRKAGSTGTDAGTTLSFFYTADATSPEASCRNKPAWAGQPCMTRLAGPATGHDPARMAAGLPVKAISSYNRYGNPEVVTESATGPWQGSTVTQTRTSTTTYDAADRVTSVKLTATGAGAVAVNETVTVYDAATGDAVATRSMNGSTEVGRITRVFDQLDRLVQYTDAAGGWTKSVFDTFGKVKTVTDSIGTTQTFSYDRSVDPRGFVTKISDSVAGDVVPTYGADGQLLTQTLPGGVRLSIGYGAARSPISRTYTRVSDGASIGSSTVVENGAGQWISHLTPASSRAYAYDRLGRLTDVRDTLTGVGSCTWRQYGYNSRAGRTSKASTSAANGTCTDPSATGSGAQVTTYSYDSADRLVSTSDTSAGQWTYDPLGRMTGFAGSGGNAAGTSVTNAFYANDMIASQQITGTSRQTWTLNPAHRLGATETFTWAAGAWQSATAKVNHYASDSDEPAWIHEDTSDPFAITRYVSGADGELAVQTSKTGDRILQLVDLHGDVMGTVPINDGQSTADWTQLRYSASDEFGQPLDLATGGVSANAPPRYGWLGAHQRSAEALGGVILMGARLYHPGIGRFLSVDPEPGGNATAYDYCSADPVNCTDLDGRWSFKGVLKKIAVVAEVAAYIPGPVGSAAGAISAGAYAATGNKRKALQMSAIAAANLVGAGAAVKGGMKAASLAAKAGRKLVTAVKSRRSKCNSFAPGTPVLLADGTHLPIEQIQAGDLVTATDPTTGTTTAEPVLGTITGTGDKHMISVQVDGATEPLVATANHPIWVEGKGWTHAADLTPGDQLRGTTGGLLVVRATHDHGWLSGQTVHNLHVANVHTYQVGTDPSALLVHNAASCGLIDPATVRFTQSSAKRIFRDGRSVAGMAAGLKTGAIKAGSVTPVRLVQRNGIMYSLDNRRLGAFKQAGVMMPYRMATRREVAREWTKKFTTRNSGRSIRWR